MTSPNSLTWFEVTGSWLDFEIASPGGSGHFTQEFISAFVTFTPRLPLGTVFNVSDLAVVPATNEVQILTLISPTASVGENVATSGTWILSFGMPGGSSAATSALPYNITAANLQTAIQGLSTIGSGNATVTGNAGGPFTVTFGGSLAATPISTVGAFSGNTTGLLPTDIELLIELETPGTALVARDTAVHIDPIMGRITDGVLCTPNSPNDTPGVYLLANSAVLGYMNENVDPPVPGVLYYDVNFTNIVYGPNGTGQLSNLAIAASTDSTAQCITDPAATIYPYAPLKN